MANTANNTISPQLAVIGKGNLAAVTACATRGAIAHADLVATNIHPCVPVNTADIRVSKLAVKAISTAIGAATVAQLVGVWLSNGTTAFMIEEIAVTAVTPSTTVASFSINVLYDDLVIPIGSSLHVSTTVTTTAATTALAVTAHGASM